MPTLSYAQLKAVWLDNSQGTKYHSNAWASLMAAIAEAESGGNTTALNPSDNGGTQTSWGLFQISNGTHSEVSPNWTDPAEQVTLAIQKLNDQGLTAWGTYDSGAYRAYYSGKTTPDTKNIPTGQSASDTAAIEQVAQAAATINKEQKDCLFGVSWSGIPGTSALNRVVNLGQSSGNWGAGKICFFTRSEARAIVGAGLLVGGGVLMLGGLGLIAVLAGIQAGTKAAGVLGPAMKYAGVAAVV